MIYNVHYLIIEVCQITKKPLVHGKLNQVEHTSILKSDVTVNVFQVKSKLIFLR